MRFYGSPEGGRSLEDVLGEILGLQPQGPGGLGVVAIFVGAPRWLAVNVGDIPGLVNKKLLKPWPSRNSGFTQLEHGDFP